MRSLFAALVLTAFTSQAYELKRDSAGATAAWKSAVHFVIAADFDARLDAPGATDAVKAALQTVNQAVPKLSLDVTAGAPHSMGYDFDHPELSTSDVLAPAEWKWNDDAVATTILTISRSNHQILEADIAFNVQHTAFAVVAGDGDPARYDVQNAMTHELGHAFGLAHNALPGTVMYPSSHPGDVSKRALAADDLDGLHFLYGAEPVAMAEAARGCSATTSAPAALAMLMVVLLRRRRALAALATVVALFLAVPPVLAGQRAEQPWAVSAVTTFAPAPGQRVLESEVTWVRAGEVQTVRVQGGRWGDLEQIVDGASVPVVGEQAERLH